MSFARRFKVVMWVGVLPGTLLLGLLVPSVDSLPVGMGEALGCSGGGNLPLREWESLRPAWFHGSAETVPVATDGFFVIGARGSLSREAMQAQLRVVVTDEDGAEVPGELSVLSDEIGSPGVNPGERGFGWAAREPLAIGARLTATLNTDPPTDNPSAGGQYGLEVAGAPTPLPTPQATILRAGTLYAGEGDGEFAHCRVTTGCGPAQERSLPAHISEQVAVFSAWNPPEIAGNVAWRIRAEPTSPAGHAEYDSWTFFGDTEFYRALFDSESGGVPRFDFNRVDFLERSESYCVSLVIEDLRTGIEQRSELCSAPQALEPLSSYTGLEECDAPPSAELTPLWCERSSKAADAAVCAAYRAGDGGEPPAVAPAGDVPERSLSGCAMGAARSGPHAGVALAGLALTALLRRRGAGARGKARRGL